jgi:single-strand DNA-binding protein
MNCFTLFAVGNLTRSPELVSKGETAYARFCLVGNDYVGKEVVTTVWFTAFGATAETIAANARKGDQLIVEARMQNNTWKDKNDATHYDHSFVVEGFRFGAPGKIKREEFASESRGVT